MDDDLILLVEDDPDDVLLARRAHKRAGLAARLEVVSDGEEAVAYLRGDGPFADRARHPMPRLLLLDLKLPRLSGLDVLAWLRAQPGLGRLPVVVLTSSRELPDVNRAYELGANSYLVKPVVSSALAGLLGKVSDYWLATNEGPELPGR